MDWRRHAICSVHRTVYGKVKRGVFHVKPGALVVWHQHDPERASRGLAMVVYTIGEYSWAEVVWYTSVGWQRGCYQTEMLRELKSGFDTTTFGE